MVTPESDVVTSPPQRVAAGLAAVTSSIRRGLRGLGAIRTLRVLGRMNHVHGFDCPSCAWPDPHKRRTAEFCENGAKAVVREAAQDVVGADFFAKHSVAELARKDERWLGDQGRIGAPMVLRAGQTHYEPISWDEAFELIADHLNALASADDAVFYTSGRTSNEAAFLYQAFVRSYGTNNLPDCSNMCHESSSLAMTTTLGTGKGAVTVESLEQAQLIVIMGQNPGTNAPRMLTHLARAKANGATIVAVNPLPEAGLISFKDPQALGGLLGRETEIADLFLQIRLGGDKALLQAIGHLLLEAERTTPGTVLDQEFIESATAGFAEYRAQLENLDWDLVEWTTGLTRTEIVSLAKLFIRSRATTICWAMGLTQHFDAVATIRELINVLLLQGNIGKPGAGPSPIRGHSNVQGDRTMGINENAPKTFLEDVGREFGFRPRFTPGLDAVGTVQQLRRHRVRVFFALGGNFAMATPDTPVVHDGLRHCDLTVQVSTKLNRSHTVTGRTALILPVLGRTDRDVTTAGPQVVTIEDSQGQVRPSIGRLTPVSDNLIGEPALVARLAQKVLDHSSNQAAVPWSIYAVDYSHIRDSIARVVPGFENFNARIAADRTGFLLPHLPREQRRFATDSGKAHFTVSELISPELPPGALLLQTLRSHDQFNTTIYGLDDRYRGIQGGRKVILVHPEDLRFRGLRDGDLVTITSHWQQEVRQAHGFRCIAYPTARDCAAAYFPETNVLVPADYTAQESNTPVSKSLVITLESSTSPQVSD